VDVKLLATGNVVLGSTFVMDLLVQVLVVGCEVGIVCEVRFDAWKVLADSVVWTVVVDSKVITVVFSGKVLAS